MASAVVNGLTLFERKKFSDVEKVFVYSRQLARLASSKCLEAVLVSAEAQISG